MATNARNGLAGRGTGELVKDLSSQISTLVHQEVELAKAEMTEKGKKAGVGAGLLAGAGIAALFLLGSVTALLILVLDVAIPAWGAALVVSALWAAATAVLAFVGRRKLQEMGRPVPEKTVESVKEDVQWLKDRT